MSINAVLYPWNRYTLFWVSDNKYTSAFSTDKSVLVSHESRCMLKKKKKTGIYRVCIIKYVNFQIRCIAHLKQNNP